MKLMAIALASAFALSSTCALASTNHHKAGAKKHPGSYARVHNYGGSSNSRGGLVGGADNGTSSRYAGTQAQPGWNNNGWNNNWNNNYARNNYSGTSNNRGGLVGGEDNGTSSRRYARTQTQPQPGWNNSYGWDNNSWNNNYGKPNNRGGLVGGADNGTRRP
jgi:hypothetical protein